MDSLRLSSFSSNVDALNEAWSSGAPLQLDRDLVLEKDIRVTIGRGHRLELFGGRIVSAPGSLILNAEEVATLGLADTVAQGDHGITVDDASLVEPGDLVHIDSRISLGPDQWRMGDWGVVERLAGNRLDFGWPLNWRYHPNRRLDYIADGEQRVFHYRLYWIPGSQARVSVDGRSVDDQVEISDRETGAPKGFDVVFDTPPPPGARVSLTTASPLPVKVYRGGALFLHDLEIEVDREDKPPNHTVIKGVPPVGSRFERIRCRERNWRKREDGQPEWGGAVFIQVNSVGANLSDIDIDGGGYGIMLRGRDTHIRRVTARDCWHPISSFHYNSHTHITGMRCEDCMSAIDGHAGSFVFAKDIQGARIGGGSMRFNGGALVDASFSAAAGGVFGFQFGVGTQRPQDDPALADPRDNPVNMLNQSFSGLANDILIQDVRLENPPGHEPLSITIAPAHVATLRNVTTAGPVHFEYGPIEAVFTHRVVIDGLRCGGINFRAARAVQARGLIATALRMSWTAGRDGGLSFESCRFDASVSEHDWIIDDRYNNGTTPRRFVDCHFTGKARLLAEGPMDRYEFINCTGPGL